MGTLLLLRGPDIRRIILLSVIAGVPLVFVRFGIDPFNIPKLALLIVGAIAAAALRGAEWLQGADVSGAKRLWQPAAAIATPLLLAWLFSPERSWAVLGQFGRFQGVLPYLLVMLVGSLVADAFVGRVQWVAWAVAGAAVGVGGYALLQVVEADPFAWNAFGAPTTAISTLGNSNFTGGFLGVSLPLVVGLAMWPHRKRRLARQLALVVVGGWIFARSQGGYAGGVAGLAVTGGLLLSRRWDPARYLGLVIAALVAVGVVAAGFLGALKPGLPLIPSTVELRGEWWISALDMGLASPAVGHGPNAYALEGVAFRTEDDARLLGYDFTDDPHSVPFTFFANFGLLGIAGFAFVVWWILRRVVRIAADDVLAAAVAGSLVAYLIQALVSIDEVSLRLTFWALLGALAASRVAVPAEAKPGKGRRELRQTKKRLRAQPLRAVPALVALGVVVAGAVAGASLLMLADAHAGAGRAAYADEKPDAGKRRFRSALSLRSDPYYSYLFGLDASHASLNDEGGDPDDADDAFAYLQSFPDLRGLVGYGRFLHQSTRDELALEVYERALAIDDLNPALRAEIGDVLLDLGRYEQAIEVLVPGTDIAGTAAFSEVWGELALARAHVGDEQGAVEAAQVALAINADEAHALEAMQLVDGDAD